MRQPSARRLASEHGLRSFARTVDPNERGPPRTAWRVQRVGQVSDLRAPQTVARRRALDRRAFTHELPHSTAPAGRTGPAGNSHAQLMLFLAEPVAIASTRAASRRCLSAAGGLVEAELEHAGRTRTSVGSIQRTSPATPRRRRTSSSRPAIVRAKASAGFGDRAFEAGAWIRIPHLSKPGNTPVVLTELRRRPPTVHGRRRPVEELAGGERLRASSSPSADAAASATGTRSGFRSAAGGTP
jgi:hypothetical protein